MNNWKNRVCLARRIHLRMQKVARQERSQTRHRNTKFPFSFPVRNVFSSPPARRIMKYLFTALLVSLLGAVPGVAQELRKAELQHAPQPDQPYVLHVSDWLARQPAARQAVAEYQRLKAAGALPAPAKTGQEPQVGDRETFRVSNFKTNEREDIVFELRVIEE